MRKDARRVIGQCLGFRVGLGFRVQGSGFWGRDMLDFPLVGLKRIVFRNIFPEGFKIGSSNIVQRLSGAILGWRKVWRRGRAALTRERVARLEVGVHRPQTSGV